MAASAYEWSVAPAWAWGKGTLQADGLVSQFSCRLCPRVLSDRPIHLSWSEDPFLLTILFGLLLQYKLASHCLLPQELSWALQQPQLLGRIPIPLLPPLISRRSSCFFLLVPTGLPQHPMADCAQGLGIETCLSPQGSHERERTSDQGTAENKEMFYDNICGIWWSGSVAFTLTEPGLSPMNIPILFSLIIFYNNTNLTLYDY